MAVIRSSHEDALLAELVKHPGFKVLTRLVEEKRNEQALRLANTMLNSNIKANQRQLDEMRGFWRGVDWFIRETKRGANAFEKGVGEE